MNEEAKLKVRAWVKKVGRPTALSFLTGKGVGASTAERLVNGRYVAKPNFVLAEALEDLFKEESQAS